MWRFLKNFVSYLWFVFSLDWFQLVSTLVDIVILVWAFLNWKDVAFQPSLLLVFFGVFINFIWQVFNVAGHFPYIINKEWGVLENPQVVALLRDSQE